MKILGKTLGIDRRVKEYRGGRGWIYDRGERTWLNKPNGIQIWKERKSSSKFYKYTERESCRKTGVKG